MLQCCSCRAGLPGGSSDGCCTVRVQENLQQSKSVNNKPMPMELMQELAQRLSQYAEEDNMEREWLPLPLWHSALLPVQCHSRSPMSQQQVPHATAERKSLILVLSSCYILRQDPIRAPFLMQ